MPIAEDNYKVEVWTADGAACLEIVSRSPDFTVSLAAWFAAIRRRPGMMLVHRNAEHVMERMVTPGEARQADAATTVDGAAIEGYDIALRDLRPWHRLRAMCTACSHHKQLDVAVLKRRFGADVLFGTVEKKLSCSRCLKGPVRLEVHSAPRD